MLITITDKSKKAFKAAAKKLDISPSLPDVSMLREDLGLYLVAQLMLAVIIEAGKNGEIYDITNHDKWKYEPIHYAEEGYVPGSSGGGFSFRDCDSVGVCSAVGARLSFNSREDAKKNAEAYPDLWEIVKLNVR